VIQSPEAPIHEGCQVGKVSQAVWHHQLVLIEKLVHVEVREGEGGSGEPFPATEEGFKLLKRCRQPSKVSFLRGFKVATSKFGITEVEPSVPEVHTLVCEHIHPCSLFLCLSAKVMFPCNVAQDGVGLGQLDVSVDEIREVWEIEAKGELLVSPARLVKVRSWATGEKLVFEFRLGVSQQQPDWLC